MVGEVLAFRTLQNGNGTGRITDSGSGGGAPVLNGHKKNIKPEPVQCKAEDKYKLAQKDNGHSLEANKGLRKRLSRRLYDTAKEELMELLHHNGNGKKSEFPAKLLDGAVPPISAKQAVELTYYLYLKVLSKRDRSNECLSKEMKSYQPNFMESVRAMEKLPELEKQRAKEFMGDVRKMAFGVARRLIDLRMKADRELGLLRKQQAQELEDLQASKKEQLAGVDEEYAKREKKWEVVLAKNLVSLPKFIQYGVPLLGTLGAAQLGIPPLYFPLVLGGLWLILKGAKLAVNGWTVHKQETEGRHIEKDKQAAKEQVNAKIESVLLKFCGHEADVEKEFEAGRTEVLNNLKEAYEELLYGHGYAKRG